MPTTARRVLGVVLAVLGGALAVFGVWTALKVGPSGEAHFRVTSKAPGALVVGSDVLNSVDVPVRVTATRSDGGALRLVAAPSADARAVLATSAVSTVSGVHYPAGRLDLRASGAGAPTGINTADVWAASAQCAVSAELMVDHGRGHAASVGSFVDARLDMH